MDLAIEYVKINILSKKIIASINHVRLHKKIILPYELVGLVGDKATECSRDELEQNSLNWKTSLSKISKPSKKSIGY